MLVRDSARAREDVQSAACGHRVGDRYRDERGARAGRLLGETERDLLPEAEHLEQRPDHARIQVGPGAPA